MMRNINPMNQALPMFASSTNLPQISPGMLHHLPTLPNLAFPAPHEFLHISPPHMRHPRRHTFHPYRRSEPGIHTIPGFFSHALPPIPPTRTIPIPPKEPTPPLPPSSSIHTKSFPIIPEVTLEKELSKETVEKLLQEKKAIVIKESGKRTRSEVWLYMGRVKLLDCGLLVKDVVACCDCFMVYPYRTKSQGTSTLRHHKCDYVFEVTREKRKMEALKKLEEEHLHQQRKQSPQQNKKHANNTRRVSFSSEVTVTRVYDLQRKMSWTEGEGRHQQRELTPEGEDRKPVMPTPPPLKEHIMNSPSPQSVHPVSLHQGTPVSGGLGGGGLVNSAGGRSNGSGGGCSSPSAAAKDSPPQQLLCVKWGNFDSNIVSMFSKLRSQEHFVDVTLWCEGKTIKCHKMILSACSMYFEKLLTECTNPHPIIFLKDMRYWEIQALVEFMYRGEVSVHQDKLPNLLQAAESLQIKGLGSPTNEMGMQGNGDSMDEEMSNSTMDMTTNSSHNNSSHLHNHINSKDDIGSNGNNNNHSLHSHHLLGGSANSNNNHQASWQKFGLNASNMMGIDLSNHSSSAASGAISLSSLHGANLPLPLSLSVGSPQSGSGSQGSGGGQASKRRKKETPRRIDLPRTAGMPLPAFNSTMGSEMEDDEDAASEDSMAAHERNHVDGIQSNMHQDQGYGDDEDCDQQDNYEENDQGVQGEDDNGSDQGEEMDEDQEGALSLRINSEQLDRERSRKGNPMKKILGIGNNNNNNEGGAQNLIHNVSSGGD